MKKRITKIWGIALVVAILASLIVGAVPASAANPLVWNSEVLPSTSNNATASGTDILDFAVAGDTTTIFAVATSATDTNILLKSVNAGSTWVDISNNTGFPGTTFVTRYVAVAPDEPNYVVVSDNSNGSGQVAYVSTNGGSTWSAMGLTTNITARNIAISSSVPPGVRYVAIPGTATDGSPAIWYYNLGAAAPSWINATSGAAGAFNGAPTFATATNSFLINEFVDLAFSPNFSADYTAVALSSDNDNGQGVQLHILSFNLKNWDQPAGYPSNIVSTATTVSRGRITTAPDYVGSDDVSRVTFTALAAVNAGATEVGGIFRNNDSNPVKALSASATPLNSIAFDGTTLVAGSYTGNTVYKSVDALATTPTVTPSRTNKRIGIDDTASADTNDKVIVAFSGANVLGAKSGVESCFSVSMDGGTSWNDISLIDTTLTNIGDVFVTMDGAKTYFVSDDGTNTSLFRNVAGTWVRVLTLANAAGYILRGAPETADAIYVADTAGTALYYTADAGDTRWYSYVASATLTDLAVESKSIVYIATGATVRKSSNSSLKYWYVDSEAAPDAIRSYIDPLVTGVTTTVPVDKYQNPMNPVTGRSQDVTFQWQRPVEGISPATAATSGGYQLRIYNDAAGMNTIADFNFIGSPGPAQAFTAGPFQPGTYTISGGYFEWTPGQTYYWRVRVSQTGPIFSAWSEMRSLTVAPGQALVPGISSPLNGASITATTPAFSWTPISGTTGYRFQLAETTSFAAPLVDTQISVTGIEPAVKLDAGKTYFWRVKAVTPVEGDWSVIANFSVAEPAPEPTPPVVIQQNPPPVINLPPITMPPAVVNLPPTPTPTQPISSGLLWAVIIIGAVLVIALIVLIIRTRRTV